MSNVFSLNDLKNQIDQEFAPLELEVGKSKIVLRNVMRLGKAERSVVMEAVKKFDADDTDQDVDEVFDAIRTIMRTCAADGKGDTLVNAIGDDLALAGEASNSPV
jgi:hypothetical protein